MKKLSLWIILVIAFGLLLAACGGTATETVEAPVVEPTQAPAVVLPEPTEVVPVVVEVDLDTPLQTHISSMVGYDTITPEKLNEEIVDGQELFLLDVRQPEELTEKGWIEGMVNIPLRELAQKTAFLPGFDAPIVAYCGSGWRCTIAMTALETMGWTNILSLKGDSFGGWLAAGYPIVTGEIPAPAELNVAEVDPAMLEKIDAMLMAIPEGYGGVTADVLAPELVEKPDLLVIDVRTAGEVESKGQIDHPNVQFIPLEEFITLKDQWPADLDTEIVVVCGSGHRSTVAMTILWEYGYTNVRSLKGGFGGWVAAGFPAMGGVPVLDLDTPYNTFLADMEGYNVITIDALNEAMIADEGLFLLDVREPSEVAEKGYIAGAVNIPLREIGENLDKLPSFDTTIYSYCGSGWRCTITLTALEAMGWEDVVCLKEGSFGGWVAAGYPVETATIAAPEVLDAAQPNETVASALNGVLEAVPEGYGVLKAEDLAVKLTENPEIILIDVRTEAEVQSKGYIDAANVLFIPLEEFINKKADWPGDLNAPIIVYCGSGHRSTIAMTMLWSYGYKDVLSLKDGYSYWAKSGFPTVGGDISITLDAAFTTYIAGLESYNTLSLDAFNGMLVEQKEMFLLDVREASELAEKGYITGAVNIPLRELGANLDKLPSFDTTIVAYCGSGWRCTIAMTALGAMGWENVLSLKGGSFGGWVTAGYPVETAPIAAPVALNAAQPVATIATAMSTMLAGVPEGYGVKAVDQLATDLIERPEIILIDVRTAEEVAKGRIDAQNVLFIPLEEFIARRAEWPADKAVEIVVYCGSGHRSTIAMSMMWSYGYTNVTSLKDGFAAWTTAGYPVIVP